MLELLRPIYTNLWYVILIALFFGGSIFVHELGHFLAARRRGLKVDRFSIGFGPKIFSWTRHGVEYRLSWIPLGGYVALPQLADMRGIEGDPTTETEKLPNISYTDKMIVSVMGAVFNLLFAFLIACLLWVIKQPQRADQTTTTIGFVRPQMPVEGEDGTFRWVPSPAAEAGLQTGDRIVAVDGRELRDWEDLHYAVVTGNRRLPDGRRVATFVVDRAGETIPVTVHPRLSGEEAIRQVGIAPDYDVIVGAVAPGTPAAAMGLQEKDVLVSINGTPIRSELAYDAVLSRAVGAPLTVVVRRGGENVSLTLPAVPGLLVDSVQPDSTADRIGLRPLDHLHTLNGELIRDRESFIHRLQDEPHATFTLGVRRGDETLSLTVPPRPDTEGRIGIALGFTLGEQLTIADELVRLNPFRQFQRIVSNTFKTLWTLIDPRSDIGLSKMSGPVGIINIYYDAVRAEIRFVLWLTVLVNINLAIFNLLPIPVLDGGHMLFATIAKLRGRALSPNFLMTTQSVFMALLLTMVLYVSFFDVRRTGLFRSDPPRRPIPAPAPASDQPIPPPTDAAPATP